MSKIYFFTDIDLLSAQQASQAYGPQGTASGKDIYQFTSRHTATGNPKAYAVCKGKLLVQKTSSPLLVNIILKPEVQAENNPPIRYYIYRGIKASSLLSGDNVAADTNTLTKSIQDTVKAKFGATAVAAKESLGITLHTESTATGDYKDTDPLENAFYMPHNDFELWTVDGGWYIGDFEPTGFGFEVLQDVVGFQPSFAVARAAVNQLAVSSLVGSETNAQVFSHWHDKEEILHYMDPAAFYGNMYYQKLYTHASSASIDTTTLLPSFDAKKEDDIYAQVLAGTSGTNFYNKNVVYLDIRNELNYSIDYFNNYGRSIRLSFADDNTEPSTDYTYYQSVWPLFALPVATVQADLTYIKLALPIGDNTLPLAYVAVGKHKQGLIDRIKHGKRRFAELEVNATSTYTTNSLMITTPNYKTGVKPRVCSYVKVKYLKRFNLEMEAPVSSGKVLRASHRMDLLFQPLDMRLPFSGDEKLKVIVYDNDFYIDAQDDYGLDYIAKAGIARDSSNYTFFASIKDKRVKSLFSGRGNTFSVNSGAYKSDRDFINFITDSYVEEDEVYIDATTKVSIIQFPDFIGKSFFKNGVIDFNREMIFMIFSSEEYTQIIEKAQSEYSSKYKVYISVEEEENEDYTKYKVQLRGLVEAGSEVTLKIIDLFGLDNQNIYIL